MILNTHSQISYSQKLIFIINTKTDFCHLNSLNHIDICYRFWFTKCQMVYTKKSIDLYNFSISHFFVLFHVLLKHCFIFLYMNWWCVVFYYYIYFLLLLIIMKLLQILLLFFFIILRFR